MHLPSCATLAACLVSLASAASLQRVNNFGNNPTNTKMFIYVPDNRPAGVKPAILVAVHHCQGTAQSYFGSTPYAKLADQYKYIVIYPESPYSGTCWDISSKAALTHGGGADTTSIANMVTYTIQQYGADANRVYVQGGSSGAMMANVLAATYPEMFKAVIAYAGVAAGCFVSSNPNSQAAWNGTCSGGNSIGTQQSWANVVRNMYPGYNGARPKMMIYHGSADTTINPRNYNETIKQWTGVFGYSLTPQQTLSNTPARGYTKYIYGPNVIGIYGSGVGHGIPVFQDEDMAFYGFKGGNEPQNPPTTTPPTSSPTTNPPPTGCSGLYGQCGGKDWTGPKCCSQGSCNVSNEWYSQCL